MPYQSDEVNLRNDIDSLTLKMQTRPSREEVRDMVTEILVKRLRNEARTIEAAFSKFEAGLIDLREGVLNATFPVSRREHFRTERKRYND